MNMFNRFVVVFVCLLLIAAAVAIIVLAWAVPQDSINRLSDAVKWLNDNNEDLQKVILTAAGAAIALVSLIVLLIEVGPSGAAEVRVTDVKVGDARLSTAAIGQRVEEAVREVPHVSEVKAAVRTKAKGVQVSLDLHVDPDANLATVSDQACQAARDVLTEKVHVALTQPPRARLHYRELRLQRAGAARAAARAYQPPPAIPPAPGPSYEAPETTAETAPATSEAKEQTDERQVEAPAPGAGPQA